MIKWLKRLFCRKKCDQKRVLEKIKVSKRFRKKTDHNRKKYAKKSK